VTEEPKSKSFEIAFGTFIVLGLIAAAFFWQNARNENRALTRGMVEAINNARQIGFALFEFETEFDSYPDKKPALEVTARITVFCPIIPGTTKFDPKPFGGRAIALRVDNSATHYEIQEDGHIYLDGINLLSPEHPVWKGTIPDIYYPDLPIWRRVFPNPFPTSQVFRASPPQRGWETPFSMFPISPPASLRYYRSDAGFG